MATISEELFKEQERVKKIFDSYVKKRAAEVVARTAAPTSLCYQIGDITDPSNGGAGGMVFALPYTGLNNTPYYWEIGLEDLSTGGTPIDHYLSTNSSPSNNGEVQCGISIPPSPIIELGFNWSHPVDTGIPNNQARYVHTGIGGWVDPLNSTLTPIANFVIGSSVFGYDSNQNLVWPTGSQPTLIAVELIPANAVVSPSNQTVNAYPQDTYLFTFSQPMGGLPFSQPLKKLTIGGLGLSQPFTTVGAEWGAYNEDVFQVTASNSLWWGTGQDNTDQILNHPALPTWPTHDIAAQLCVDYNPPGTNTNRWFLPSLQEFFAMWTELALNNPTAYASLNLSTETDMMGSSYWTSSEYTNPATGFNDDFYAFAFNTRLPPYPINSLSWTGPHLVPRCHSLSVRPIRKFECIQQPPPPTTSESYNFRDSTVTWIDSSQQDNINGKGPFVGVWLPGAAGSWKTYNSYVDDGGDPWNIDHETVIGQKKFRIRLATTDAVGNMLNETMFYDGNNPNGYTISIWNNKKVFLGTWHYVMADSVMTRKSRLNPSANGGPIQQGSSAPSWYNNKDFPDYIELTLKNPDNSHPDCVFPFATTVIYGDNRPLDWGGTGQPPNHYHNFYNHPYMTGAFNCYSGSYAYIKIECEGITNNVTTAYVDLNSSNNTAIGDTNVVCAKIPMEDSLSYIINNGFQPGVSSFANIWYGNRMPHTGGFIGVGGNVCPYLDPGTNNIIYPDYTSVATNYYANPLPPTDNLGWPAFIYAPGGGTSFNPGPYHYIFEWLADFQPTSTGLDWFPDYLSAYNSENCSAEAVAVPCNYQVGDVGPAGGIIVAVPYMNISDPSNGIVGPVVAPLQGTEYIQNPTEFYFELSPNNLNYTNCSYSFSNVTMWGLNNLFTQSIIDLTTSASYSSYWVPEGNTYSGYLQPTMLEVNELVGEGLQATNDIIAVNNGNPLPGSGGNTFSNNCGYDVTYESAFKKCYDYQLNGYTDWFLPTTEEMAFARNYTSPGTLHDTTNIVNFQGTPSNNDNPYYWTCNSLKQDDSNSGLLINNVSLSVIGSPEYSVSSLWGTSMPLFSVLVNKDITAYVVSMNPISSTSGPDGLHWRTLEYRYTNANVRAMRRFICV